MSALPAPETVPPQQILGVTSLTIHSLPLRNYFTSSLLLLQQVPNISSRPHHSAALHAVVSIFSPLIALQGLPFFWLWFGGSLTHLPYQLTSPTCAGSPVIVRLQGGYKESTASPLNHLPPLSSCRVDNRSSSPPQPPLVSHPCLITSTTTDLI